MSKEKYFLGGTIVKFQETVYHYTGQGNKSLTEVELPFNGKTANCKTYWSESEPVIVQNKFIRVEIHPDGTVKQELHPQVKEEVVDIDVKLMRDFVK